MMGDLTMENNDILIGIGLIAFVLFAFFGNWLLSAIFNKAGSSVRRGLDKHAQKREEEQNGGSEKLADKYKKYDK